MLNKYLASSILGILGSCLVRSSPISYCPDDSDVCFQWASPGSNTESNPGNLYFQIQAPTSYQWVGLGIGSKMSGASIFVLYEDGQGNVTLSEREGKGHTMPLPVKDGRAVLLEGSGVRGNHMIANVVYKRPDDNEISDYNDWIMAKKEGSSLASTDPTESISQHDTHAAFSVDLTKASIESDSNPFAGSSGEDDGSSDGLGPSSSPNGGVTEKSNKPNRNLILAHGIILTIIFIAMYPLGAILMPLLGKWYIHASWQTAAFLVMWAGFGIGYVVSYRLDIFFDQAHTQLGVLVVALISIQPVLGVVHHLQYRRQGKRGMYSYIHIWFGRVMMILGMINGGLGLQLAQESSAYIFVYSIAAAVVTVSYISYSIINGLKKGKKQLDESNASIELQ